MRLIDADELLKHKVKVYIEGIWDFKWEGYPGDFALMVDQRDIWNAPTVDPMRHGEWVIDGDLIKCSHCRFEMFGTGYYFVNGECVSANDRKYTLHYCPHCGAKMDGGSHDGKQ